MSDLRPQHAAQAAERVDEHCRRLGFALWGVCDAVPSEHGVYWRRFADEGRSGTMGWLADTLAMRADVEKFVPGAKSVIAVADAYVRQGAEASGATGQSENQPYAMSSRTPLPHGSSAPSSGKVARYAHGRDYHKVMKKRLHALCDVLREHYPGETFRATVDTAPLHEREHAARAGLGWVGKNTLLIHPRHGSYLLLGCVVSTLRIEPFSGSITRDAHTSLDREEAVPLGGSAMTKSASGTREQPACGLKPDIEPDRSLTVAARISAAAPITDHCAKCTRCIDACPTGAIDPAGYTMDPRQCVSYLTIEHDGPIPQGIDLSGWIAGCDICQEVCPYNSAAQKPSHRLPVLQDYTPRGHAEGLSIHEVMRWDEDDRLRHTAGTALTRIKLEQWRRNAAALAGDA